MLRVGHLASQSSDFRLSCTVDSPRFPKDFRVLVGLVSTLDSVSAQALR